MQQLYKIIASLIYLVSFYTTQAQQYNFVLYNITDGLPQNKVTHLLEDSNGYIWLATENGGVSRFDGNSFENFSVKNGLSSNSVSFLGEYKSSEIYVETPKGFDIITNSKVRQEERSISILDTNNFELPLQLKNFIENPSCQLKEANEKIWIGSKTNGLVIYNPKDSSTIKITEREGLPSNQVNAVIEDSWGNVWLGTNAGLVKYLGETFTHFDKSNGLHGNKIYALEEDHNGKIWVAASNNGIATFDGNQFTKMTRDQGYIDLKTNVIFETSNHEMWIGTHGGGLLVFDSSRYSIVTIKNGLPSSWINDITEDNDGNIWVSTPVSGIGKIMRNDSANLEVREFTKADGLPDTYITTLKYHRGKIYFATNYGKIGCFEKDSVKAVFTSENGLPGSPIKCLLFRDNQIFVGTHGNGIYTANLDEKEIQFSALQLSKSLTSNRINLLAFDPLGYLWAGTERGINKISLQENPPYEVERYGKNEGFLGVETCANAVLEDSKGNLWFGTTNGLTRHKPSNQSIENFPPKIHFEDIALFYKSLSQTEYADWQLPIGGLKEGLELPYNKNHISFDFKAINQSYSKAIKYKWQLLGAEEEWSPLSKKTSVNYSNLKPGNYAFQVQAFSENQLSSKPISSSFTILKPFWQIAWVRWLALALLLLTIIGFALWRIKFIQKREKKKRQQLEMENHMLQLESKALQLQMNPHFIFNALNSIQSLVATQNYDNARAEINNFAVLMRSILSNSKKEKISLEEEVKTLKTYLELEQFCQPTNFDFKINTNGIDLEETEIPPMLLQPFVENSIIHGISHLKEKRGDLSIDFNIQNNLLECIIIDNGVGRKQSQQLKQSKKKGHQSVAMEVTTERLEALKGNKKYTAFKIEDLENKVGNPLGTKVMLRLPYESSF